MPLPAEVLDALKDDLGIPAGDATNDAWLQRQAAGIWARMERFCERKLSVPPASFVDDWGELVINQAHYNVPPAIAFGLRATVFLREVPVRAITALELDGTAADVAAARWDVDSGKLFNVRAGSDMAEDLTGVLWAARARITYTAGWDTIPPDLYQVLLGGLQPLWAARSAQQSGAGGGLGTATEINIVDVGSVSLSATGPFVGAASASLPGGGADPLLGPWLSFLQSYRDLRNAHGVDRYPTTKPGPVVVP